MRLGIIIIHFILVFTMGHSAYALSVFPVIDGVNCNYRLAKYLGKFGYKKLKNKVFNQKSLNGNDVSSIVKPLHRACNSSCVGLRGARRKLCYINKSCACGTITVVAGAANTETFTNRSGQIQNTNFCGSRNKMYADRGMSIKKYELAFQLLDQMKPINKLDNYCKKHDMCAEVNDLKKYRKGFFDEFFKRNPWAKKSASSCNCHVVNQCRMFMYGIKEHNRGKQLGSRKRLLAGENAFLFAHLLNARVLDLRRWASGRETCRKYQPQTYTYNLDDKKSQAAIKSHCKKVLRGPMARTLRAMMAYTRKKTSAGKTTGGGLN